MKLLLATVAAIALLSAPAAAQLKSPGQIQQDINAKLEQLGQLNKQIAEKTKAAATGQPAQTGASLSDIMSAISKPFQELANFIDTDAVGAATLATQIQNLQDTNGKACWTKMQDASAVFKLHPVPVTLKAMTDFEALRLLQMNTNSLCSYTPCTVVFADGANLATAVASQIGGALAQGAVPSLQSLCAKIPQLAPMMTPAVITALSGTPSSTDPTPSPTPTPAATSSPTPSPSASPQ